MKTLRLLGMGLLFATAWAAPTASNLMKSAEAKAKHEHKNVLLIFHASWCGWCHKLDDLLNSPEFKTGFDRSYVVVHVTVLEDPAHKADENPGGLNLLTALGGKDGGIPFYAVFTPKNRKLGDSLAPKNIGYPGEPNEIVHFMKLMKTTSRMTPKEQADLQAYLSKKA